MKCCCLHIHCPFGTCRLYNVASKSSLNVCLFVLRFYGPVNPVGSCRARSVYLITRLLGKLCPLSGLPVLCTFFRQKLITAFLESAEGRDDRRKYFMINLHERMVLTSAGVEAATSWSPFGRASNSATKALSK